MVVPTSDTESWSTVTVLQHIKIAGCFYCDLLLLDGR